ncbi:hypothetical protein PAHAL_8G119100 [Panicum hallii]|uniref:Uncharacterized protein n=1 Tax=Panicum hallii TaxID=206008 RepID=A0A2T8I8K2_9POAL|nr:hypothetical protein PAHAL_8G118100 [Panicum hallii]PAN42033.1 hypothetical protein PAHAL_8G118100 [Panicum hallii]PAN42175.1 hypothetical protein PAHAL_8G118100 [Panicum hallii]PAN42176.1 hypothetical protein PAHAL_8G119100 [Panicum hallii]PVH34009.1 hypothetical protein PAHAL_8G119100 [Panicum hallii]
MISLTGVEECSDGSSGSRARGGAARRSGVKILEGQAVLSVQDQLGRRSQLLRESLNSKRPPWRRCSYDTPCWCMFFVQVFFFGFEVPSCILQRK